MDIAVVDDDRADADLLIQFLYDYRKQYSFDITVTYFSSGEDFLASVYKNEKDYMIIFLDIFMEKIDGLETARRLWERDSHCLTVFLTSSQEYIWQAAQLHFFDYIDKQYLIQERVFKVISDARKKLSLTREYLDFTSGSRQVHLPMEKIQYILSDNNYTIFGMRQGEEYHYRIPFSNVLKLIDGIDYFLNCNRGIVLNMNDILREETDVYIMKNGQRFPIRKLNRTSIRHIYHSYQFKLLDEM